MKPFQKQQSQKYLEDGYLLAPGFWYWFKKQFMFPDQMILR
jgi:hypothetical protein